MKSISVSVCTLGLLAYAGPFADPGNALDSCASIARSQSPSESHRMKLVRSRSAYEVHGLTAPVDRSLEVLEGDAFAWRRRRARLA